jgi:hypothetical protein
MDCGASTEYCHDRIGRRGRELLARSRKQSRFAFELTTGVPLPGQTVAHSVGFVKQGFLGVAYGVMSFAWSTFIRLSPGMNLRFVWT